MPATAGPCRSLLTGLVGVAPAGLILLLHIAHRRALRQGAATRDRLRAAMLQARADHTLLTTFTDAELAALRRLRQRSHIGAGADPER